MVHKPNQGLSKIKKGTFSERKDSNKIRWKSGELQTWWICFMSSSVDDNKILRVMGRKDKQGCHKIISRIIC